jgi:hypothetical protein
MEIECGTKLVIPHPMDGYTVHPKFKVDGAMLIDNHTFTATLKSLYSKYDFYLCEGHPDGVPIRLYTHRQKCDYVINEDHRPVGRKGHIGVYFKHTGKSVIIGERCSVYVSLHGSVNGLLYEQCMSFDKGLGVLANPIGFQRYISTSMLRDYYERELASGGYMAWVFRVWRYPNYN